MLSTPNSWYTLLEIHSEVLWPPGETPASFPQTPCIWDYPFISYLAGALPRISSPFLPASQHPACDLWARFPGTRLLLRMLPSVDRLLVRWQGGSVPVPFRHLFVLFSPCFSDAVCPRWKGPEGPGEVPQAGGKGPLESTHPALGLSPAPHQLGSSSVRLWPPALSLEDTKERHTACLSRGWIGSAAHRGHSPHPTIDLTREQAKRLGIIEKPLLFWPHVAHICKHGSLLQDYRMFLNICFHPIHLFQKHRLHIWRDGGAGKGIKDTSDNLAFRGEHGVAEDDMVITSWPGIAGWPSQLLGRLRQED
nr:uncharacterized protein LOC121822458 [Peromyscus maniculatus bairdii]